MKEILINNGFVKVSSCSCGGVYTEKYKKGLALITLKPNRNFWSLKINSLFKEKGNQTNLLTKLSAYELI